MANYCDMYISIKLNKEPDSENRKRLLNEFEKIYKYYPVFYETEGRKHNHVFFSESLNEGSYGADTRNAEISFWNQEISLWHRFSWGFPWTIQVGFAGAPKVVDVEDTSGVPPTLYRTAPISTVQANYQNAYVLLSNISKSNKLKQVAFAKRSDIQRLKGLATWSSSIKNMFPTAEAMLNWHEVTWTMTDKEILENNHPNEIMSDLNNFQLDIQKLHSGRVSRKEFLSKYSSTKGEM